MKSLTHLSLFSGIGGLDLAAELAGFKTIGQCEWAEYPTKVLEKHWPDVPRWKDIHTLTKESFYEHTGMRTVDVISGGFPCQPFSTAGKRRGDKDDRYLWPEMLRVVKDLQPAWVIGENVAGIISMALDQVLFDMEAAGYETRAIMVPACGVDAPHRRYRVAILGHSKHDGLLTTEINRSVEETSRERPERSDQTIKPSGTSESGNMQIMDDRTRIGQQRERTERKQKPEKNGRTTLFKRMCSDVGFWPSEPGVGRVANGVPNWVDRIKCLGNAVVPQQFYPIFKAVAEVEENLAVLETVNRKNKNAPGLTIEHTAKA